MSVIHELSSVAPLELFNLWQVPATQVSVRKTSQTEVRPLNALTSTAPLVFEFSTSPDQYVLLGESQLYLRARVDLEVNGASPDASVYEKCHPAQNIMHTLIKSVEIYLNDKLVCLNSQNYAHRAWFENFLGFSNNAKKSHLQAGLWTENAADRWEFLFDKKSADSKNTVTSKTVELLGRLHNDLCFSPHALIGGVKIRIRICLNEPSYFLNFSEKVANLKASLELEAATWHPVINYVSPVLLEGHLTALSKSPAKYFITRSEIKHQTLPQGVRDVVLDNFITGQLPRRVFLTLIDNNAFNGAIDKDPFNFDHFSVNFLALYVNGLQTPEIPYQPSFSATNPRVLREFMALYQALDQNGTDTHLVLKRNQFFKNPIFAFNLSPDQSNGGGIGGHLSVISNGNVRIQLKFDTDLSKVITVMAYCEFDNLIEIDSNRNVFTDFV